MRAAQIFEDSLCKSSTAADRPSREPSAIPSLLNRRFSIAQEAITRVRRDRGPLVGWPNSPIAIPSSSIVTLGQRTFERKPG
jgi:hypothetical protein